MKKDRKRATGLRKLNGKSGRKRKKSEAANRKMGLKGREMGKI